MNEANKTPKTIIQPENETVVLSKGQINTISSNAIKIE